MLLVKANFGLFSYSVFLVLEIETEGKKTRNYDRKSKSWCILSYILYTYLILFIRNSRHQLQTMSDNSSVVLLFPPGMSLLQFGSKVCPRKFLFQGFWRFHWVSLYGGGPAFLLHFRKMQMRKQREVLPDILSNNGNPSVLLQVTSVQKFALSEIVIFTYKIEYLQ